MCDICCQRHIKAFDIYICIYILLRAELLAVKSEVARAKEEADAIAKAKEETEALVKTKEEAAAMAKQVRYMSV
jgi:hypothetical protein